ncbi:type II secretion system protein N [Halothiobacillus sp.]|uniref:type II secretion system protein N n=1 Tax=Halothiobacillus sp. TaxID=1891311 RepID=UPI00260970F8|nr:type II secretion system protein N [Halothiobacillus sp.]
MSRKPVKEPALRRPRSLIWPGALLLMASWFVALLVTAPITLIPVSRLALPPGVALVPLGGTVWHGQWRLNSPRAPAMTIQTDFLPLSIIRLQPAWHVRAQTAARASQPDMGLSLAADVGLGFKQLNVRNLHGRLAADSPLIAALTAWPLNGLIDFSGDASLIRTKSGFDLKAARAMANWRNAAITTTEPLFLGDLVLDAKIAQGQLKATIKPASGSRGPLLGELNLAGLWPVTTAPKVSGYLQATAGASEAFRQQLNLLGHPDASGKITIQGVMPGRY